MKFAFFPRRRAAPAAAPRPARRQGVPLLLLLVFFFLALLLGMVGGLDSPALLMIVAGAIFATLLFLLVDFHRLFLVLALVTFLLQGSAMYFLHIRAATWVAVGMAGMFFARLLLELVLRTVPREDLRPAARAGLPAIVAAGLFVLCFVVSVVMNRLPVTQIISSTKSVLPMFGVLLALICVRWGEQRLEKLWQYGFLVLLVQLPVVVVQHFVYAVNRNFDSVVGTFGGTPGAGGNSAVLVLFTIIMMGYTLSRWNQGLLSTRKLWLTFALGLAIILLGEVKASFIWLPLTLFWVLRRRLLRNVGSFLLYSIFVGLFMSGTYFVYNALYWGKTMEHAQGVSEKLNAGGGYFFDPRNVNYRNGEVSRVASVALWMHDPLASPARRLIGYGPGASRPAGTLGAGDVARRYAPLHLDASALAVLLWDVGILGALAYSMLLVLALAALLRFLRRRDLSPAQRALADTCVPALLLFCTTLLYNRSLMDEPTAQLLLMICLGSGMQLLRFTPAAGRTPALETPVTAWKYHLS